MNDGIKVIHISVFFNKSSKTAESNSLPLNPVFLDVAGCQFLLLVFCK